MSAVKKGRQTSNQRKGELRAKRVRSHRHSKKHSGLAKLVVRRTRDEGGPGGPTDGTAGK